MIMIDWYNFAPQKSKSFIILIVFQTKFHFFGKFWQKNDRGKTDPTKQIKLNRPKTDGLVAFASLIIKIM